MLEFCIPVLTTIDIEAAIAFYSETLSFSLDSQGEGFAQVSRDGLSIMLQEVEEVRSQQVMYGTSAFDALYQEFVESGAIFVQTPDFSERGDEFRVKDYDENILWFVDLQNLGINTSL